MNSFEPRGRQTLESFASRNAQTGQRSAAERGNAAEPADSFAEIHFAACGADCSLSVVPTWIRRAEEIG
jgi:hypothetical protein